MIFFNKLGLCALNLVIIYLFFWALNSFLGIYYCFFNHAIFETIQKKIRFLE